MNKEIAKISEAIYGACKGTGFKVGFQRDGFYVQASFNRDNHKTTWVSWYLFHGWRESHYEQEEIVSRDVSETEAMEILRANFDEFGGEFLI